MEGLSLCSDHQVARTQRSPGLKKNFSVLDHHDNKSWVQVLCRGMMEDHRRRGPVQALTPPHCTKYCWYFPFCDGLEVETEMATDGLICYPKSMYIKEEERKTFF